MMRPIQRRSRQHRAHRHGSMRRGSPSQLGAVGLACHRRPCSAGCDVSDAPWTCLRIYVVATPLNLATFILIWFFGTSGLQPWRQRCVRAFAGVGVTFCAAVIGSPIVLGPDPVEQWPLAWAAGFVIGQTLAHVPVVWAVVGPERSMPFQSRPTYLALLGACEWCSAAAYIAALLPWERALRTHSPWPILIAATLRIVKTLDSVSDVMHTTYLYQKVSSKL